LIILLLNFADQFGGESQTKEVGRRIYWKETLYNDT
jgi:hypothetical protein